MNSKKSENSAWRDRLRRQDKFVFVFLAEGLAILLVIAQVFYKSFAAVLFMTPLLIPIIRRAKARRRERLGSELLNEFKEMAASVLTALKAGYSAENAMLEALGEMEFLYGPKAPICRELLIIRGGLENHIPLESLLDDFAARSGIEEIREFADVFAIAKRSGGNMTEILMRTIRIIQSRIEVENEIGVLLSAKKMEQKIMDVVPFVIIIYIGTTSRGFFDVLYHNVAGIIIMTACLGVYAAAYLLSEKIVQIRV